MKKEFIPYDEALALKELGFDEECLGTYYEKDKSFYINGVSYSNFYFTKAQELIPEHPTITTPLYQQAFRWFREKYHIIGEVKFKGGKTTKTAWYDYVIYSEIDWNDENPNEQWKKHEEAELECLKKLIEIIKNK